MTAGKLDGKRVLLTQASEYMGPAISEVFREEGAVVIEDESDLRDADAAQRIVDDAGEIDVRVANLAAPANLGKMAAEMDDATWHLMFDKMVHPLHRLCRAASLPVVRTYPTCAERAAL